MRLTLILICATTLSLSLATSCAPTAQEKKEVAQRDSVATLSELSVTNVYDFHNTDFLAATPLTLDSMETKFDLSANAVEVRLLRSCNRSVYLQTSQVY